MARKLSLQRIKEFLHYEASGGWILFFAGMLAIIIANSPFANDYFQYFNSPITVTTSYYSTTFSRQWLIDEGLMSIFFLLVTLEIKRSFILGELQVWKKRALPGIAALGGMLVPATIYLMFNYYDDIAREGWAIPCATDIAFALGVLSLLGNRVPIGLKIFLTALAILDDLGAITIIAVYYTKSLNIEYLLLALLVMSLLVFCKHKQMKGLSVYCSLGVLLWFCVLQSGLHATLAGVMLALTIPINNDEENSPLHRLEKNLHPWVVFIILPLFAFANAGVHLGGLSLQSFKQPIVLGIMAGLLIGKPVGVTLFSYLAVKTKIGELPDQTNWQQMIGLGIICGVGFTMSLFISLLAFPAHSEIADLGRLGIIVGSLLSGFAGYLFLMSTVKNNR